MASNDGNPRHDPPYTIDEAAALLRVSRRTMERYISAGKVRTIKVAGRVLIPWASVDAILGPDAA